MKPTCPNWGETGKLIWEYGIYRCERCFRYFLSEEAIKTKIAGNSDSQEVFVQVVQAIVNGPRGRKRNKRLRLFPLCFQFLKVMFPWVPAPSQILSYLSYTSKV